MYPHEWLKVYVIKYAINNLNTCIAFALSDLLNQNNSTILIDINLQDAYP